MTLKENVGSCLVLGARYRLTLRAHTTHVRCAAWDQVIQERLDATLGAMLREPHRLVEVLGPPNLVSVAVRASSVSVGRSSIDRIRLAASCIARIAPFQSTRLVSVGCTLVALPRHPSIVVGVGHASDLLDCWLLTCSSAPISTLMQNY